MEVSGNTKDNTLRQTVDPNVSHKKFQEEVGIFRARADFQRQRGIILLEEAFPNVELMFLSTQLVPSPVVFAVRINFSNYDLEPLSISFINPFTKEQLRANQVLVPFLQKVGIDAQNKPIVQPLLQSETPDGVPFLCIPGTREYHNHPCHTGDSWFLHRKLGGEGSLGYLVDKLFEYGSAPINLFRAQLIANFPMLQLGVVSADSIPE